MKSHETVFTQALHVRRCQLFLEVIDAAEARTHERNWKNCTKCGNPIGDDRLDALPATELCVTCKANRGSW